MRGKDRKQSIDNYSYGLLVWQIAKDGEEPFDDISESNSIDRLKHDDKELGYLMRQLDDEEDMPEEFKIVFAGATRYIPEDRTSLADVRGLMKIDDIQFTEAKAAFEANAKELPRDIANVEVCSYLYLLLYRHYFLTRSVHLARFYSVTISLSRRQSQNYAQLREESRERRRRGCLSYVCVLSNAVRCQARHGQDGFMGN